MEHKRGKRGGSRTRKTKWIKSVKIAASKLTPHISQTERAGEEAIFYECADNEETAETHIIPRESITKAQHLGLFDQKREYELLATTKRLQLDKTTNTLVETTDERYRVAWTSDRTLLRRDKPDNFGEGRGTRFKRLTSRSKQVKTEVEVKQSPDNTIDLTGLSPDPNDLDIIID